MPEPNTVETNNEPTLDQFNDTAATQQSAASEPAAADTTQTQQTSQAQQTSEPAAGQSAQQQTQQQTQQDSQQQTTADPYATVLDGVQIPDGVQVDEGLVGGLKQLAKQHNMPADAVKALIQLDLNNLAAQQTATNRIMADMQAKWSEENKAKYGDNLKNVETNCSRVLAELDKEGKFKELLATVGVSGHPATLGFLKTIGDLYLEKASVNPNATVSTDEEVELENFN